MKNTFITKTVIGLFAGSAMFSGTVVAKTTTHAKVEISLMQCADHKAQNDEYTSYREEQKKKIEENKRKIDELRGKKNKIKKENQAKYEERIDELEAKNDDLKKRIMKNYKNEGKDKWESFKKEFKDTFRDNEK